MLPVKRKGKLAHRLALEAVKEDIQGQASSSTSSAQTATPPTPPSPKRLQLQTAETSANTVSLQSSDRRVISISFGKIARQYKESALAISFEIRSRGSKCASANLFSSSDAARDAHLQRARADPGTLAQALQEVLHADYDVRYQGDLAQMDYIDWVAAMISAGQRRGYAFVLSSRQKRLVKTTVPLRVTLDDVHSCNVKMDNPLRPKFGQVDLDSLDSKGREAVDKMRSSASAIRMSIPASYRKEKGLKYVSISLGASKKSAHEPPPASERFRLWRGSDGIHKDYVSTKQVCQDDSLYNLILESYAYRLLCDGLQRHLDCSDGSFILQDFLNEHCSDPWTPAIMPTFSYTTRKGYPYFRFSVASTGTVISFRSLSPLEAATDKFFSRVRMYQDREGREWVVEHAAEIVEEWLVDLFKDEIKEQGLAKWRKDAFSLGVATYSSWTDGNPDELMYCRDGTRRGFHKLDAKFPRRELVNGHCPQHVLYMLLPNTNLTKKKIERFIAYDDRRGKGLTEERLIEVSSTQRRLLFEPVDVDWAAVREELRTGKYEEAWRARLAAMIPALRLETDPQKSISTKFVRIARGLKPSLDLDRQFDPRGRLSGHGTQDCVAQVPEHFQRRRTTHPVTSALPFACVGLARVGAITTIDFFASILDAGYDFFAKHALAGKTTEALSLTRREIALDKEFQRLLDPTVDTSELSFVELKALLARYNGPPPFNVDADLKRYRRLNKKYGIDAAEASSEDGAEDEENEEDEQESDDEESDEGSDGEENDDEGDDEEGDDGEGSDDGDKEGSVEGMEQPCKPTKEERRRILKAAQLEVDEMDEEAVSKVAQQFRRIAELITAEYGTTFEFNPDDGMPAIRWPPSTPSKKALKLIVAKWTRAMDRCDEDQLEEAGYVWTSDGWWRAPVAWMMERVQLEHRLPSGVDVGRGERDYVTLLRGDESGRKHHALNMSEIAHLDHSQMLYNGTQDLELATLGLAGLKRIAACNATRQLWWLNRQIKSDDFDVLEATFTYLEKGATWLVERLAYHFDEAKEGHERLAAEGPHRIFCPKVEARLKYNGGGMPILAPASLQENGTEAHRGGGDVEMEGSS